MLLINNISYKVPDRNLLQQVNAAIRPGAVTALMGSNGAGKSTLLKIISGELKPSEGSISWGGKNLAQWDVKELAKTRAVLRQQYNIQMPFSVFDIISMGRYPHFKNRLTEQCKSVITKVAEYTGVDHFLKRNYLTLSGGEQQRVQLARVLAQVWDTPSDQRLILLDEPVSALDIHYQHQLLALVKALTNANFTIVAVLHDLNLAMQYADDVLLLKHGKTVSFAGKEAALNEHHIYETFGVEASLHQAKNYPHSFITVCPVHKQFQHLNN
ncbi:MAG: heme ABC transporter ATP-binding protein [Taibaiella sp.]